MSTKLCQLQQLICFLSGPTVLWNLIWIVFEWNFKNIKNDRHIFIMMSWLFWPPKMNKKNMWRNANQDKVGLAYCKYRWEASDNCEMSRTAGIFQCPTWISAEEIFISWLTLLAFTRYLNTVGSLKDWTNRSVWSKTTLITGGVGGERVNPPSWKTGKFFLRSLTLSEPIYRNFQSNEAKWRNFKLKDYTIPLFME